MNGLTYLMSTSDEVYVKSSKQGQISKDEFLTLIPSFKVFYEKTNNFFPLANIYISERNIEKAYEFIEKGIRLSIFLNSYRQLKYYCILANICNLFDVHKRKGLLKTISNEFNNRLYENYSFYFPITQHYYEMNNILLHANNASLVITASTNIDNTNHKMLSELYKAIDMLIGIVGIRSDYSINFSYNSAADLQVIINSLDTATIVALITSFTTIFISGIKGISQLPKVIADFKTAKYKIEKDNLEINKAKLDLYKETLEIQKIKNELTESSQNPSQYFDNLIENIEPVLESCDRLIEENTNIYNMNYTTTNIDGDTITEYTNNILYNS